MTFPELLKEIDKKYDIRYIEKALEQVGVDTSELFKKIYDAGVDYATEFIMLRK